MNEEIKQQQKEYNEKMNEDEINLMDYWRIISKRKKGIMAIVLIAVLITGIISEFVLPKIYEASGLVEIAKIKGENLMNPADIITTFKEEATLSEIGEKMGWNKENQKDKEKIARLEESLIISKDEKGNLLKITALANTPEEAKKIVEATNEVLIARHQKRFEGAEKLITAEIETITQEKEKTKKDIEKIGENLARINQDIANYEKEIAKRSDIQSEGQGRIAESYINLLAQAKNQKESEEAQILELEQKLVGLEQSVQQKEYEKTYETTMTRVVTSPTLPTSPIGPRTMLNVFIAAILGLFVGIFWAFGAEYVEKNK